MFHFVAVKHLFKCITHIYTYRHVVIYVYGHKAVHDLVAKRFEHM